jgi:uncharacterized protein (TIRG00374 family)
MNKLIKKALNTIFPLLLGGFILYFVYKEFDFSQLHDILLHDTDWWWMSFSLLFGVLSHVLRGWRWRQVLEPLDCYPRRSDCVNSIFISYAANLVLPRVGEVSRCGVLKKYDDVPFAKSLGTVVTERIIDTICMAVITGATILLQMPIFVSFFRQTGVKMSSLTHLLTSVWFYITLLCCVTAILLLHKLLQTFSFYHKLKSTMGQVVQGMTSLRRVDNKPLFVFYTVAIWLCYFFHFYLTFRCFGFTEHLGVAAGLVMFVGGTIAVIVPTPNGAGPWHFAVISMMMLYGINNTDAAIFALIVHAIQTFLVVLLGIYGLMALQLTNHDHKKNNLN